MAATLQVKPQARVLVVDDEQDLMLALVAALELDDYEVAGFGSSLEALAALRAGSFDVLVTDLMMPDLDGMGLLRAALEQDPSLIALIMTGQGTVSTAVEALKLGAFDYILKPFNLQTILLSLERGLELRRVRLENLQLRETVALYDLSQAVSATLDPALVAELTAAAARQQLSADEASVLTLAAADDELVIAAVAERGAGTEGQSPNGARAEPRAGRVGQRVPVTEGVADWIARHGEPLLLSGPVEDARFKPLFPRAEISCAVAVPMIAGGRVTGVLTVNALGTRRPFTPGQVKALSILANAGAAALENGKLVGSLRASETRYRELIEHATDAIVAIDPQGNYVEANSAFLKWLGYTRAELAGLNTRDVVAETDQAQLKLDLAEMAQGKPVVTERQLRRKDGSLIQVELAGRQLPDGDFQAFMRDISERKRADQALRDSEARFAALFQASPAAITLSSLDGIIVDVNQEFERAMGWSRAEAVGQRANDLNTWAEIEERDQVVRQLAKKGALAGVEVQYRRKSGEIMRALSSFETVEVGGVRYLLTLALDITDRKRAEDQVRFQAGLLGAVGQAVIASDPQGRILYWNHMAEQMYGWTAEEVLGQPSSLLSPAGQQARGAEILEQVRQGQTWSGEYVLQRRDGSTFPALVTDTPFYDNQGRLAGIIGMSTDNSERKQREREMETIAQLSAALRAALTAEQIPVVILEQLGPLFGSEAADLSLLDPAKNEMRVSHATGRWAAGKGTRTPANLGIMGHVMRTGLPYATEAAGSDPLFYPREAAEGLSAVAVLPLIAHGQTMGSLAVGRAAPFSDGDLRLLASIADLTANALQRATLHEQTRLRAEQLAGVNELARALAETLLLEQIYQRLDAATRQLLPAAANVVISLFDPEPQTLTDVFRAVAGQQQALGEPAQSIEAPGLSAQAAVVRGRRPVIDNDAAQRVGARSSVMAPLLAKGEVIGVLQAYCSGQSEFGQDEADLLATVANTAAVAIENARLFAETRRRLQRLQALRTIDLAITSSMDSHISLRVLVDQAATHLGVDAVDVLLLDSQSHRLELTAGRGFRAQPPHFSLRVDEGEAGRAFMERRLLRVPHLGRQPSLSARSAWISSEGFVAYFGMPLVAKGMARGVLEVFHRAPLAPDAEWIEFLETLSEQAAIAVDNSGLFADLQRSNTDLELAYDTTLEGWSRALDLRDKETEGHTQRVTDLTERLARAMGLSEGEMMQMRRGSLLHDIGKMGIPDSILLKPGPLTDDEWVIMRQHPVYAFELLSPIAYLRSALDIPYCHHEKWDGSGYPRGLKGELIPLAARIFSVVDVWDALRSDRAYRPAWPEEQVREHIRGLSGTHFDPRVVQAFMSLPLQ